MAQQVITDTKDPRWGQIVTDTKDPRLGQIVTDTKDPNWGLPVADVKPPAPPPFNAPRISQGRGTQIDLSGKNRAENTQMFLNNAPAILGSAAAGLSGGASIPVQVALTGMAGAIGQGIKDTQWDMPDRDRVVNMLKGGAGQAITQGVGHAIAAVSPALTAGGRSLWNRVAKISEPVLKKTQTMRAGGTLIDAKNEIAETLLSQNLGTIRPGNLKKMSAVMEALDTKLDDIIKNSTGTMKRQMLRDELLDTAKANGITGTPTSAAAKEALAAFENALEIVNGLPANITVQEAQAAKRLIYKHWNYAAEAKEPAKAMADKALGRGYRSGVEKAEPIVGPINADLSKQIPAASAMGKALSRTGNRDFIGLSQLLVGVVTNPVTVAGALLNHPAIGSFTAQQLYNAAKMVPKDGRTVANIIRMATSATGGGDYSVMDQNGVIHTFASQAQSDGFKKAAGIR